MKVTLRNKKTGKVADYEPVDAREILDNPDTIYEEVKPEEAEPGEAKTSGKAATGTTARKR